MLYWVFGFLRMGTTGITAQHYGAGQQDEVTATLLRSLTLAVAISLLQLLLQEQVLDFAFRVMETGPDVALYVNQYFHICIWGAPAMLMQYCFFGWFIAVQEARFPLYVSIFQNVVNIVCSAVFVFVLHWSVRGVALGTLLAQWGSVALSAVFLAYWLRRHRDARFFEWRRLLDVRALLRLFDVNKDIFLRTLCLVCVTLYFTSVGTEQGEVVLSANVFLMQFFTFYSYFMDGFAYAGESLTGKYYGARQMEQLRAVFIRLFRWGGSIALVFTLLYAAGGRLALTWLTDNPDVIDTAAHYLWWVILIPFVRVPLKPLTPEMITESGKQHVDMHPEAMEMNYRIDYLSRTETDCAREEGEQYVFVCKNKGTANGKKLMVLGDSFAGALMPFLNKAFSETVNAPAGNKKLSFYEELMQKYQPDVVADELIERYFSRYINYGRIFSGHYDD